MNCCPALDCHWVLCFVFLGKRSGNKKSTTSVIVLFLCLCELKQQNEGVEILAAMLQLK